MRRGRETDTSSWRGRLGRIEARNPGSLRYVRGAAFAVFATAVLVSLSPGEVTAQEIGGQVVDAGTGAPLASAEVIAAREGEVVARTLTNSAGRFTLILPEATTVEVSASLIGYRTSSPTPVTVESAGERVEVRIRLSTEAIEIDGLTVTARGVALRHQATVEGFLERQKTGTRVGPTKLFLGTDGLVRSASNPRVLMRNTFSTPARCLITFVNGRPDPNLLDQGFTDEIVGYEFYKYHYEAPLELRAQAGQCTSTMGVYSVMALWTQPRPMVRDPATIQLRIHDEATGQPLLARVFEVLEDSMPRLVGVIEDGVGELVFPSDEEVVLVARSGGYFDSAPILLTPEDREEGVAMVWMRHVEPSKQYEAVQAAREAAAAEAGVQRFAMGAGREVAVKVRDGYGEPLSLVQVWADTIPLGITNAAGFFRHTLEEPVQTSIRLTRLGLAEVSATIDFEQTAQGVLLQTTMYPQAIELDPITVTAVPRRMLADVESTQHSILSGRGSFVNRRAIEVRGYPPSGLLAQGLPGVRVRGGVPYSRRNSRCGPMAVFVDGMLMMGDTSEFLRTSSLDVELVEIYPGGGSVPARYQMSTTQCGVIAYWTRRGGDVQLSDMLDFRPWRRGGGTSRNR